MLREYLHELLVVTTGKVNEVRLTIPLNHKPCVLIVEARICHLGMSSKYVVKNQVLYKLAVSRRRQCKCEMCSSIDRARAPRFPASRGCIDILQSL